MFQLKYDNNFNNIIKNIPHWKTEKDIPTNILNYIKEISDKRLIYAEKTKKYYCGNCTEELDENNYCPNCKHQYNKYTEEDIENDHDDLIIIDEKTPSSMRDLEISYNYFVFDTINENAILYLIKENITYSSTLSFATYKNTDIYIDESYSFFIEKNGITKLQSNIYLTYEYIDKCLKSYKENNEIFWNDKSEIADIIEDFEFIFYHAKFYVDNLEKLKNTIYKYTRIWELSDYLKNEQYFSVTQFTLNPLYYKQFEYLVNYKLYNLALNDPDLFTKKGSFKETFEVDKKYLPFMISNNITSDELSLLRLYPTTNTKIFKFFSMYASSPDLIYLIKDIKVNLEKMLDYLTSKNLLDNFDEYLDYISMARTLGLDLKNKRILYPKDLSEAHDNLFIQIKIVDDPIIDSKIKSLAEILSINKYEDEKYIIYPASSIMDLVDESKQQSNCVRIYCDRVADNRCHIYFLREKKDINKSLVTIEVRNNKIVQARVKYNELPSDELKKVLNKWEKTLVPVLNKE